VRIVVAILVLGAAIAACFWSAALPPSASAVGTEGSSPVAPGPFPKTAMSPLGERVLLREAPRRIVSIALSADEILIDLVPPERLVGITVFVDDPSTSPASGRAPRRAARVTGEPESLLALAPDIVFASNYTRPEAVSLLTGAGIPVVGIGSLTTFDAVLRSVTTLGDAVGEPERAHEIVTGVRERIDAVVARARTQGRHARILLWEGSYTYGKGTLQNEMVRLAGGVNVAAEAGLDGPSPLTEEAAVAFDPDMIVVPVEGGSVRLNAPELLGSDPIWGAVGAARRGEVYGVPRAWIGCVSHDAVRALEALADILDRRRS
jgi:iron complex transport system substrate-binding protein